MIETIEVDLSAMMKTIVAMDPPTIAIPKIAMSGDVSTVRVRRAQAIAITVQTAAATTNTVSRVAASMVTSSERTMIRAVIATAGTTMTSVRKAAGSAIAGGMLKLLARVGKTVAKPLVNSANPGAFAPGFGTGGARQEELNAALGVKPEK